MPRKFVDDVRVVIYSKHHKALMPGERLVRLTWIRASRCLTTVKKMAQQTDVVAIDMFFCESAMFDGNEAMKWMKQ